MVTSRAHQKSRPAKRLTAYVQASHSVSRLAMLDA
jgi:hypothetical protein